MSGATFTNPAQRIGKIKGEILAHAIPVECLAITGQTRKYQKNSGDTVIYRRWLPYGGATTNSSTINQWVVSASAHITQEGVTPPADSLTPQDITVIMQQYSCLYMYTDKTADIHEDDLPAEFKRQTGQRMGLVREMIRFGELKAGTNAFYAGGTSRSTVVSTVSSTLLAKISRSLLANHAQQVTTLLAPSPNFNTVAVEPAFLVFCHTDLEHDIRQLPGFKEVAVYGTRKMVHDMELGSVGRFRFVVSPELSSYADSGGAVGSTGMVSTSASNIDVYPMIVVAEEAWGEVALRGLDSFDITDLKPSQKDKNDPHGQRGYYGAKFWSAAKILNQGWMAILECGATALS
jgi:N4-gp56 family major capsid protein